MMPLDGLKVLDLSWVVAGPLISRTLADFGAEVLRVESPVRVDTARVMQPFHNGEFGPERSYLYQTCNAGKSGVAIDLAHHSGQEIVCELVPWADVVLESFSPGTLAKWGLDYSALSEINPRIIMVSSSLMGQTGPLSGLAGFGNIGASVSGFQAMVGTGQNLPLGPYGPYTDYVAPRLGLTALLAAIIRQRSGGIGCHIDLSQVEAGVFFLSPNIARFRAGCEPERARGNNDETMFPHGVFPCVVEDGLDRFVAIAVRDLRDWRELAQIIGRPEWGDDADLSTVERRRARASEICDAITAWTSESRVAEVEERLIERGIPAYRAVSAVDYPHDPQIVSRAHIRRVPHEELGEVSVEGPRVKLSETPGRVIASAPTLGRDTRRLLKELLGYDDSTIDQLVAEGVVK